MKDLNLLTIVRLFEKNCLFVLMILNKGAYLTFMSIFHKALNLFKFDCEITLESVPGINEY